MNKKPDISAEELVAQLKALGMKLPTWMTDIEHVKSGTPLTHEELMEFAEIHSGQRRAVLALRYLISCGERFGKRSSGYVFQYDNVIIQIDRDVIETLLQHQIEGPLLERNPADGYISVMKFYMGDERKGGTWMTDFIDDVLKTNSSLFLAGKIQPPAAIH